jgi:hypothetical protein
MAADHLNYEEEFNLRYKVPPLIVNVSYKALAIFFILPTFYICFSLGDMVRLHTPHFYSYIKKPNVDAESPTRYETMYFIKRVPMY